MRGTLIRDIWRGVRKLMRDQRGNAMMLTAAAIVPVIGIVGSGIDIGRGYMAELRLQQACDAGVLADRRYMGVSSYGEQAEAEANKMFAFNFPEGFYGSEDIEFSSEPQGTSDVVGTASARLPTSIMYIFGFDNFDLSVNCAAKLEISNLDIMLVLDVTGSMQDPGTGDQPRIDELKEASMTFFDTLTSAEKGDGLAAHRCRSVQLDGQCRRDFDGQGPGLDRQFGDHAVAPDRAEQLADGLDGQRHRVEQQRDRGGRLVECEPVADDFEQEQHDLPADHQGQFDGNDERIVDHHPDQPDDQQQRRTRDDERRQTELPLL